MAGWWLCSVMTSYTSVRTHGCCLRNRPLRQNTALAQGSPSAPRTCQSAHRCVRPIGGTISRRFETFSCSCAGTVLLGRGQQLRTDGARRWAGASTRLSADASGFMKCHWEVDGTVHEWLSETTVLDLPRLFQAPWEVINRCRSLQTHKHD